MSGIFVGSFNRRRDACFPATEKAEQMARQMLAGFNRRRDACFPATPRRSISQNLRLSFNRRRDACFPATTRARLAQTTSDCFNRRRDACFPATAPVASINVLIRLFQSQTRRLLPRNTGVILQGICATLGFNRRRDACFPATALAAHSSNFRISCFNRRRDACFPATSIQGKIDSMPDMFQSQTRRLLPRNAEAWAKGHVFGGFNRRRDACFPATSGVPRSNVSKICFNRRRDACFPATR